MKVSHRAIQLALLLAATGLAGCVPLSTGPDGTAANPFDGTASTYQSVPRSDVDMIEMSHKLADAMVAELMKNDPGYLRSRPILVTNFVQRSNIEGSSEWGLLLADHVSSRLSQHGFVVIEPKLRRDLAIREQEGEFILTRDLDRLPKEYRAYAVVTGTYTKTRQSVDFTTRLVQIQNQRVLASVDARMPIGGQTRELFDETKPTTRLPVVGK
jgi:hypothetical protein